jgi:hypothetical protein
MVTIAYFLQGLHVGGLAFSIYVTGVFLFNDFFVLFFGEVDGA